MPQGEKNMLRRIAAGAIVAGAVSLISGGPAQAFVVLSEMGVNEQSNSVNTLDYDVTTCDPCYVPFRLDAASNLTTFNFNAGVSKHSQSGFVLSNPADFSIVPFTNGSPPAVGTPLSSILLASAPGFGNDDVIRAFSSVAANRLFAMAFSGSGGTVGGRNDAQTKLRFTLTSVVPLPVAAPLFLSALAGLWGVRRWRSTSERSEGSSPAAA
jgi:hypothetical protein